MFITDIAEKRYLRRIASAIYTLIDNTKAFIDHHAGLNVLLKGDMGTGKSTMVKALLDTFANTSLRMIEIKKDQIGELPSIISRIKERPYAFILFVDDLSFVGRSFGIEHIKAEHAAIMDIAVL